MKEKVEKEVHVQEEEDRIRKKLSKFQHTIKIKTYQLFILISFICSSRSQNDKKIQFKTKQQKKKTSSDCFLNLPDKKPHPL